MIGAGTAISVDFAKAAIDAGAQFLLTPGTPIDVLQIAQKKTLCYCLGRLHLEMLQQVWNLAIKQ